jgi:hypothetical protein
VAAPGSPGCDPAAETIAQGKAKLMIVVMPLGYGTVEIIRPGWGAWSHTNVRDKNFSNFRQALLTEVMPKVESEYLHDERPQFARECGGSRRAVRNRC